MRRGLLFLCFSLQIFAVYSQQSEHYIQYTENKFLINPAAFTTNDNINISSFYRLQSPNRSSRISSQSISFQTPLNFNSIGFGGLVRNDWQPGFKTLSAHIASSYRIKAFKGLLSMGMDFGMINKSLTSSHFIPKVIGDPVYGEEVNAWVGDLGYGLYYASNRFYLGVSNKHLDNLFNKNGTLTQGEKYRFYVMSGYKLLLNEKLEMDNNIILRKTYLRHVHAMIGSNIIYNKTLWIGGGITNSIEWNIRFGAYINEILHQRNGKELLFGYCFQGSTASNNYTIRNTHELMCAINLFKRESFKKVNNTSEFK